MLALTKWLCFKGEKMIKEIEHAVQSIEQDIFEQIGVEYFNISVTSNGFSRFVKFIGIDLWNSDDDMREYVDKDETEYEPLETFLRRQLNDELKKLRLIKV